MSSQFLIIRTGDYDTQSIEQSDLLFLILIEIHPCILSFQVHGT
jgi:hypothetical protein